MHPGSIGKVIGVLLMFFSLTMLTPLIVGNIYDDHNSQAFYYSFVITFFSGLVIRILTHKFKKQLSAKDGFFIVIITWIVASFYGALPYIFSHGIHIGFSGAVFEAVSGFTTTGSTVITGLEHLPKSILYYRQQTQLLGGMGIIVLSVAILPMLGVGGMQLYKAEASGPWKENKLTPHIAETAKSLWRIYVALVFACILFYWAAGMNLFNAISYGFSTISTGGFAPTDASMVGQSHLILAICIIFMVLGSTSFTLHHLSINKKTLKNYWKDAEFKAYIYILFFASIIIMLTLMSHKANDGSHAFWDSIFQVVSIESSTGFVSYGNYYMWPGFIPILLMFIALVGGCAGSTAGGFKVVRAVLLMKQVSRESRKLIHPQGLFVVKFGNKVMSESLLNSISGFITMYFLLLALIWLALMGLGLDSISAFSVACSSIANAGPALGVAGENYASLSPGMHWVCDFAMLAGRLELFTIVVMFTPDFWKH